MANPNEDALEEEIRPQRIIPEEDDSSPPPDRSDRINPILEYLRPEGVTLDHDAIRSHFNRLWAYEKGDAQPEEEQFLTTVALFMYIVHLGLSDQNFNTARAREVIARTFTAYQKAELDQQVAAEKAAGDPFKAFVDGGVPRVDAVYTWRYFLLDHKTANEKKWDYKMKDCWFARFFIRYGRVDFIETACAFDKIPSEARKDYVSLKLTNTFAKLGTFCQFQYTPAKK